MCEAGLRTLGSAPTVRLPRPRSSGMWTEAPRTPFRAKCRTPTGFPDSPRRAPRKCCRSKFTGASVVKMPSRVLDRLHQAPARLQWAPASASWRPTAHGAETAESGARRSTLRHSSNVCQTGRGAARMWACSPWWSKIINTSTGPPWPAIQCGVMVLNCRHGQTARVPRCGGRFLVGTGDCVMPI